MRRQIQLALKTTRDFAAAVGVAAMAGFYAAERSALWLAIATVLLAGTWYLMWRIRRAVAMRSMGPKQVARGAGKTPWAKLPLVKTPFTCQPAVPTLSVRRFVCFDPDTGEEIYKSESLN